MYWKALLISFVIGFISNLASSQYLGLGGVVGKNITPRGGSTFPAWARDPNFAANSGRAIYGRVLDYGYSTSGGYRPATYKARSSYGRR